jgi:hypothetical protein
VAYDHKKFGNLTEEEIAQGKNRKWEFSIREIQRTIKDIKLIDENSANKTEKIYQVLYENFAFRWKEKKDREVIRKILEEGLKLNNPKINFNLRKFM